jgi:hypothetical protein
MEEERSPILDVVSDVSKVPLPVVLMASSSSGESSLGVASGDAEAEAEDTIVMDPCESTQSYDFGASSIAVGRIRQLESL